jgi:hypothetical protein
MTKSQQIIFRATAKGERDCDLQGQENEILTLTDRIKKSNQGTEKQDYNPGTGERDFYLQEQEKEIITHRENEIMILGQDNKIMSQDGRKSL